MTTSTRTAKLVMWGLGGISVEWGGGCSSSGCTTRDFLRPDFDGAVILDKRAAVQTPEGLLWVFKGPIVDVDLDDGDCDVLGSHDISVSLAAGVEGVYAGLLASHVGNAAARGPLDSVSMGEYIQGWVDRGARVGRIVDGDVVWDD